MEKEIEQPIEVDPTTVEIVGYAHVVLPLFGWPGEQEPEPIRTDDGE